LYEGEKMGKRRREGFPVKNSKAITVTGLAGL
jgi:hypothetical protein